MIAMHYADALLSGTPQARGGEGVGYGAAGTVYLYDTTLNHRKVNISPSRVVIRPGSSHWTRV